MDYVLRHCDITQFTLTYSIISMFTSLAAHLQHDQISHIMASKTRLRHSKFANSIAPTYTSQIIHLLVVTTSLEYLLILVV